MAYTELHFHLLPGLDDGPRSMEDTVELATLAAAEGTRTIVATPHVHPHHIREPTCLPEVVRAVQSRLRAEGIPIEVLCGGELSHHMVGDLGQHDYEAIAQGPVGRRWLLLEASLGGLDASFTEAADELRARGFGILIAHPERSLRDPEEGWSVLEAELAQGSVVQVNAWSLAGYYGNRVRREAFAILAAAPMGVVASDAHGPARPPSLGLALPALAEAGDRDGARRMGVLPQLLLRDGLPVSDAVAR
jgi:protein-tyrosine phosphatase